MPRCHTNETRWPGHSAVAQLPWYIAHDVHEGREHLNFSEWGSYDITAARHNLEELCEEVREVTCRWQLTLGYTRPRHFAPGDVTRLCEWTDTERGKPMETETLQQWSDWRHAFS